MTTRAQVWIGVALLLACSADERTPPDDARAPADSIVAAAPRDGVALDTAAGDTLLTPNGWGPLRIGMSRAQVVAALGDDANPDAVGGPEPEACDQFRPERAPEGMLLMVERDTLTRITLMRDSGVRTDRGLGLGDSASAVRAAYGSAAVASPHKYRDAPSAYITVWTTSPGGATPARGIVYEVGDDGRVAMIHAGGESIQYVEGCL